MKIRDSAVLTTTTGVYIGTLLVANVTAGKLFSIGSTAISVGAFAYLVCLATTDFLSEVYGSSVTLRLVRLATIMNIISLGFQQLALHIPIAGFQKDLQPHFEGVFKSSAAVIFASVIGFPVTDTFETVLWKRLKKKTKGKYLFLRNAAVKIPSQLIDSTIFYSLAFFILPKILYGSSVPGGVWTIMKGAWLYGLFKGVIGTSSYLVIRPLIPWVLKSRDADIRDLEIEPGFSG
jgi:queuosine precursor transporter